MNWFGWIIVGGALYKQRNMFQENRIRCPLLSKRDIKNAHKNVVKTAFKKEIEQMHFVVFL
jgi:hypothetical protein